jgi:hypothetical protein
MNVRVIFREKECQAYLENTLIHDFLPLFLWKVRWEMGERDQEEPIGLTRDKRREAMIKVIR